MEITTQGRCHHYEGGFPRARHTHCTPDVLSPEISPNVGNSTAYGRLCFYSSLEKGGRERERGERKKKKRDQNPCAFLMEVYVENYMIN